MIRLAVAHSFGLLETSSKWDLKSTLIIRFIRDIIGSDTPASVSVQQAVSLRDPGIFGPQWVSKISAPKAVDGDDVLAKLLAAVDATKADGAIYDKPTSVPVEAEWTGWREGVKESARAPTGLSESEIYDKMMQETTSDVTILYMHGGGLYLMDPAVNLQLLDTGSDIKLTPAIVSPTSLCSPREAYRWQMSQRTLPVSA